MKTKKQLKGTVKGKFLYDYKYDILTFKIQNRNYKKSIELQNFVVDIDEEDFVTGIRIFDASKVFGVNKYNLKNIVQYKFEANIENNVITIRIKFVSKIRNKMIPIFSKEQNFMQQITTPVAAQHHLADSSVMCAVGA